MTWQWVHRCIVVQVAHFTLTAQWQQTCMDRNGLSSSVERWGRHAQQNADGVDEVACNTCSSSNWVLGYGGSWTICGPPDISETTTARKLNLKLPLDMVKYPLWIQKLFCYMIQHEGSCRIDFRQVSTSLRQSMANNCNTAFSLHVVESASDDYNF